MIFVDSNIPMYLVGAAHPHKVDSRRILEETISDGERLVTDAKVFQEILHRYSAINRLDAIQPAFEVLQKTADEVFPVEMRDVETAKNILQGYTTLSARDAIHIAIMERYGVSEIVSFDQNFKNYPGITILD